MSEFKDFELTEDKLSEVLKGNAYVADWCEALNKMLPQYEIDTLNRAVGFIAQCAHESGNFKFLKENLNYRWDSLRRVFPKYFPNDQIAKEYAHKPEAIANRVYANRMGNGPESTGDGFRYCGRGLIQLTGKNNYAAFAKFIEMDLAKVPAYLTTFDGAVEGACWFWAANNLNTLADNRDVKNMTRVINGGYNGLQDRLEKYATIYKILGS